MRVNNRTFPKQDVNTAYLQCFWIWSDIQPYVSPEPILRPFINRNSCESKEIPGLFREVWRETWSSLHEEVPARLLWRSFYEFGARQNSSISTKTTIITEIICSWSRRGNAPHRLGSSFFWSSREYRVSRCFKQIFRDLCYSEDRSILSTSESPFYRRNWLFCVDLRNCSEVQLDVARRIRSYCGSALPTPPTEKSGRSVEGVCSRSWACTAFDSVLSVRSMDKAESSSIFFRSGSFLHFCLRTHFNEDLVEHFHENLITQTLFFQSKAVNYRRYKALSKTGEPGFLLQMADTLKFSPSLLCRFILESYLEEKGTIHWARTLWLFARALMCNPSNYSFTTRTLVSHSKFTLAGDSNSKKQVNSMLKDSSLIYDEVLAFEVFYCTINDPFYGPYSDAKKETGGELPCLVCSHKLISAASVLLKSYALIERRPWMIKNISLYRTSLRNSSERFLEGEKYCVSRRERSPWPRIRQNSRHKTISTSRHQWQVQKLSLRSTFPWRTAEYHYPMIWKIIELLHEGLIVWGSYQMRELSDKEPVWWATHQIRNLPHK